MHRKMFGSTLASTNRKPVAGESFHDQKIQINKVIDETEKCVFYFAGKNVMDFFGQHSISKFCWKPDYNFSIYSCIYIIDLIGLGWELKLERRMIQMKLFAM